MKSKKKVQISVYVRHSLMNQLSACAAQRRKSLSTVAEAAIGSFLLGDADEKREAAIIKRLDKIDRRIARMEDNTEISVEMIAVFVRFWLLVTPPLPEPAAMAARTTAGPRYENFLRAFSRRLNRGPKLRDEIPEDIPPSEFEFDPPEE